MDEPAYPSSCVERFLRYVTYDTQSDENSTSYPSTEKQLVLLRQLADELRALGLEDVELDRYGYVMATVPATTRKKNVPVIGFLAHVDTSPEVSGAGVRPIVHRNYQGQPIVLPGDPTQVLRPEEDPALAAQVGRDIITGSGTTLLGADDKAGVAEIMGAVEWLMAHPEIPHGTIRIAFTPDEEVGRGVEHFDVERFGARYAYTLDGGGAGELEAETFAADSMTIVFQGFNTHPGYAKDKLVNAIKLAAQFLERLPKDTLSPETTEGYEGYVHPYVVEGGVDRTSVKFLIRDFDAAKLKEKEARLESLARDVVLAYPRASLEVEVKETYRNMREVIEAHPEVLECAEEAIRGAGLEVRRRAIRGGTDGAKLSFMGLPTPNLFAGEHNFHSRLEWTSTWEMHKAVEVIVRLCQIWEARTAS